MEYSESPPTELQLIKDEKIYFWISDANEFLKENHQGNYTPFIYEKSESIQKLFL